MPSPAIYYILKVNIAHIMYTIWLFIWYLFQCPSFLYLTKLLKLEFISIIMCSWLWKLAPANYGRSRYTPCCCKFLTCLTPLKFKKWTGILPPFLRLTLSPLSRRVDVHPKMNLSSMVSCKLTFKSKISTSFIESEFVMIQVLLSCNLHHQLVGFLLANRQRR